MLFTMQRTLIMAVFLCASLALAEDQLLGTDSTTTPSDKTNTTPGDSNVKRIFDFKLTPDMKTEDLDNPSSVLSKMIAYIVKSAKKASTYVSIVPQSKSATEIKLEIRDDSIFSPGDNPANAQHGFR
jgi:hypothetical protein